MLRIIYISIVAFCLTAVSAADEFGYEEALDKLNDPAFEKGRVYIIEIIKSYQLEDQLQRYVDAHDALDSLENQQDYRAIHMRREHRALTDEMKVLQEKINAKRREAEKFGVGDDNSIQETVEDDVSTIMRMNIDVNREKFALLEEYRKKRFRAYNCDTLEIDCDEAYAATDRALEKYETFRKGINASIDSHNALSEAYTDLAKEADELADRIYAVENPFKDQIDSYSKEKREARNAFIESWNKVSLGVRAVSRQSADDLYQYTLTGLADARNMDDPDLQQMIVGSFVGDLTSIAAIGHHDSRVELSDLYAEGDLVEKDLAAALRWLTVAAKDGTNWRTMVKLSDAYKTGHLGVQSDDMAAEWIEKATDSAETSGVKAMADLVAYLEKADSTSPPDVE